MDEKIRILFLSSNPRDTSRIRVDEEAREVFERIEEGINRGSFELLKYPAARAGDLQRLLMKHSPHIVHFSGHSSLSKKILLEGTTGKGKQVEIQALVEVFNLYNDHVRVVVLNACFTQAQAHALSEVIDYTVGISDVIGDRAAVTFAGAFYRALSFGMTVRKAFKSAQAEVKLLRIPRSRGLELLVRKGADEREFPPSGAAHGAREGEVLLTALRHLASGQAAEDEAGLIRQAMLESELILEQTEDVARGWVNTAQTRDAADARKSLHAQVDAATYRLIQEQLFPPPPGIGPPLPGLIVIGREDSLADVRGLLRPDGAGQDNLNLTVVRGWPGVGKTTLVGVVGRDPDVLREFPEGVLWTSLERHPELMSKLAEWGRALGTDEFLRIPTLDEAAAKLNAIIRHRRMLLIVDDIWDPAHAVPFLTAATGSRCALLATTRRTAVAEALTNDEKRVYLLPVLSEDNALTLLRYLAPSIVERYQDECRDLVRDLGCLPLALHVAGRLLKAEEKMGLGVADLIEGIREGAKLLPEPAPLDRTEGDTLPTVQALLRRSTNELDELSRDCFAYLGPFAPKPATFDLAAMRAVWQMDDPTPVVRKLVGHGLLEPVGTGRFQMHELLVQHARSLLT